jgi:dienelactone hydrolase
VALAGVLALWACAEDITMMPVEKGRVTAEFDPSKSQVPTPTDLIKNPLTGMLMVPDGSSDSAAQKGFNAYLRSLDGYPTGSTAEAKFDGALSKDTVEKGFSVYEVGSTGALTEVTGVKYTVTETKDSAGKVTETKVQVAPPTGGWKRATQYVTFVESASDKLMDGASKTVLRSALFELAVNVNPLCEWAKDKYWHASIKACTSDKTTKDSSGKDVPGVPGCCTYNYNTLLASTVEKGVKAANDALPDDQKMTEEQLHKAIEAATLDSATSFERIRSGYTTLLKLATGKVKSDNVVLMWNFTTLSLSELIYDPTSGTIPFPNALLLDQKTGMVNLPATPGESEAQKKLRLGLNTLDGFTTTGNYYALFGGDVDTTSVPSGAVITMDLDAQLPASGFAFSAYMSKDTTPKPVALLVSPTKPLKEKTTYGAIVLSKMKSGSLDSDGGLKDKKGRRFASSTFMALIKLKDPLVDGNGKSTISSLDDTTAATLELARKAHQPLWQALEALTIKRDDIVCAWTFKTQSITAALTQLRALPWKAFGPVDMNQPKLTGALDTTLSGYPTGEPKTNIGGWIKAGTFTGFNAIDEAGSQAFLTDPTKGKPGAIQFTLTIPKGTMPSAGWPLVLYQHGLNQARVDIHKIADQLAKEGFATIAFDTIYHGPRSWCTMDAHCAASGATCTVATGKCSTGALKDSNNDGIPDASGVHFLNVANPFAIRDNIRQHVIDAAALLRAVVLGGASGITGGTVKFNPAAVSLVGQSLGGILGTLVLATDSAPLRGVLNVPGSPLPQIILTGPNYKTMKDAVLKSFGVTEGTAGFLQLENTFHWILDPADPGNFGEYVNLSQLKDEVKSTSGTVLIPKKDVIVQLAGKDQTIPVALGKYLAATIGADTTKTLYANQGHGFLLTADTTEPKSKDAAQIQVTTFLKDGKTICTPNVTTGACN